MAAQTRALFDVPEAVLERETCYDPLRCNDYPSLLASAQVALLPLSGLDTEAFKKAI